MRLSLPNKVMGQVTLKTPTSAHKNKVSQPRGLSVGEWINKSWPIHSVHNYSTKMNEATEP